LPLEPSTNGSNDIGLLAESFLISLLISIGEFDRIEEFDSIGELDTSLFFSSLAKFKLKSKFPLFILSELLFEDSAFEDPYSLTPN
jgi:hypothetical protein